MSTSQNPPREGQSMSRRSFLQAGTFTVAGLALASAPFTSHLVRSAPRPNPLLEDQAIRTSCGLCVNKCGVTAWVRDGVIRKLDPIDEHPKSRGMLCARGNAGVQALYDPNRVKSPLIRVGERGAGRWRQTTWDEALDHVAENLLKVRTEMGPEGVMFSSTEGFQEHFFRAFAEAWGSPNVVRHPTLCLASMVHGMFSTFGEVPAFDLRKTRYIILAGANRFEALVTPDSVDLMRNVGKRQKLVVLDPRFTITASKADDWFPIRPGTDLAFVLAMMSVIFEEGLQDQNFLDRYTIGQEALREHVRKHTPEWAAEETGIAAREIRRVAREFASAAPAAVFYPGRRSSWTENDTQFRRGIAVLNAIVGAWDRPGGCLPKTRIAIEEPLVFPPDDIAADRCYDLETLFPLANHKDGTYLALRRSILESAKSPIGAWMIYKQNPLHSVPNTNATLEMMKKIGFIVAIDTSPSDTAWMADVILPESMYLERTDPPHSVAGAVPVVLNRRQVVPPRHDTKSCIEIVQGLAERLGLAEYFDYTVDDWIEAAIEPLTINRKELDERGFYSTLEEPNYGRTLRDGYRFRTKSGKIELESVRYREQSYPALPTYVKPRSGRPGAYRLITGRSALYTHAALQSLSWLGGADPEGCAAWIHPKVADRHGLSDGDVVRVRSSQGEIEVPIKATPRIREDCVFVPHGFGSRSAGLSDYAHRGGRDSELLEDHEDTITGNAAMHETFVELFPTGRHIEIAKLPVSSRIEGGLR